MQVLSTVRTDRLYSINTLLEGMMQFGKLATNTTLLIEPQYTVYNGMQRILSDSDNNHYDRPSHIRDAYISCDECATRHLVLLRRGFERRRCRKPLFQGGVRSGKFAATLNPGGNQRLLHPANSYDRPHAIRSTSIGISQFSLLGRYEGGTQSVKLDFTSQQITKIPTKQVIRGH